MPSQSVHLERARRNIAFLDLCEQKCDISSKFPDWKVTIQFYVAVHVIDAVLSDNGRHPESHEERWRHIREKAIRFPEELKDAYGVLYGKSITARYLINHGSSSTAKDYKICNQAYDNLLKAAKKRIPL